MAPRKQGADRAASDAMRTERFVRASEVIRAVQASPVADPSEEAIAELRTVVAYNDIAGARAVPAAEAVRMLQSYAWQGVGVADLNALCQRRLGRHSYASR